MGISKWMSSAVVVATLLSCAPIMSTVSAAKTTTTMIENKPLTNAMNQAEKLGVRMAQDKTVNYVAKNSTDIKKYNAQILADYQKQVTTINAGAKEQEKVNATNKVNTDKYNAAMKTYQAAKKKYDADKAKYDKAVVAWNKASKTHDAEMAAYQNDKAAYDAAILKNAEAKAAYDKAMKTYNTAMTKYRQDTKKYMDAKVAYNDAMSKYNKAKTKYDADLKTFNTKLAAYKGQNPNGVTSNEIHQQFTLGKEPDARIVLGRNIGLKTSLKADRDKTGDKFGKASVETKPNDIGFKDLVAHEVDAKYVYALQFNRVATEMIIRYDGLKNSYYTDASGKKHKIVAIERHFNHFQQAKDKSLLPGLIIYNDPQEGFRFKNMIGLDVGSFYYDETGQRITFDEGTAYYTIGSLNSHTAHIGDSHYRDKITNPIISEETAQGLANATPMTILGSSVGIVGSVLQAVTANSLWMNYDDWAKVLHRPKAELMAEVDKRLPGNHYAKNLIASQIWDSTSSKNFYYASGLLAIKSNVNWVRFGVKNPTGAPPTNGRQWSSITTNIPVTTIQRPKAPAKPKPLTIKAPTEPKKPVLKTVAVPDKPTVPKSLPKKPTPPKAPTAPKNVVVESVSLHYHLNSLTSPVLGRIQLHKLSTKNVPIANAEYKLTMPNGKSVVLKTDAKGIATSNYLDDGAYTVMEVKAPEGYELDPAIHTVTLDGTKSVYRVNVIDDAKRKLPNTGDNTVRNLSIMILSLIAVAALLYIPQKKN